MDAAVPCKKRTKSPTSSQETGARLNASNKVPKTKYVCVVDAHDSKATSGTCKYNTS